MKYRGFTRAKVVISAVGMAICLLSGCAETAKNENQEESVESEMRKEEPQTKEQAEPETQPEPPEKIPELDYHTCPSGTIVERELTPEEVDGLFYAGEIPQAVFARMDGCSYVENENVALSELRYLRLLHVGFDGKTHVGELVVHRAIAEDILEIFRILYDNGYQIEKMHLIDDYGGDDDASCLDNNTSAFNYRVVGGTTKLSRHAYGLAVDINPFYNPYITYPDGVEHISPEGSEPYADRDAGLPHMIGTEDDLCLQLFRERGFTWGGDWKTLKDYQHFQMSE